MTLTGSNVMTGMRSYFSGYSPLKKSRKGLPGAMWSAGSGDFGNRLKWTGLDEVIFENCYLNDAQKIRLCEICGELGADWVKTSTGFASGGATINDLRLMRANVSDHIQVKAAGGVRTLPALLEVIDVGVTRCGATATATILDDFKRVKENAALATSKPDSSAGQRYISHPKGTL